MDSGVALGGQARAQQKKLARLRRRAKGLPMNLEEFRIGGISLIKKWDYGQSETVAYLVENFPSARRRFRFAHQLQAIAPSPSHTRFDETACLH